MTIPDVALVVVTRTTGRPESDSLFFLQSCLFPRSLVYGPGEPDADCLGDFAGRNAFLPAGPGPVAALENLGPFQVIRVQHNLILFRPYSPGGGCGAERRWSSGWPRS